MIDLASAICLRSVPTVYFVVPAFSLLSSTVIPEFSLAATIVLFLRICVATYLPIAEVSEIVTSSAVAGTSTRPVRAFTDVYKLAISV